VVLGSQCYPRRVGSLRAPAAAALALAAAALAQPTAAVALAATAIALAATALALAATAIAVTAATVAVAAAAVAVAAFAALYLHADERHPFVGRCQRRLRGGGPAVGERAVRSTERAAARRCG